MSETLVKSPNEDASVKYGRHPKFPWLTLKQGLFVENYAETGNARGSCVLAGYAQSTATTLSSKLARNPGVVRALAIVMEEQNPSPGELRLEVTKERIEQEFAKVGFSDITQFLEWNRNGSVSFKSSDQIPPEALATIRSLNFKEGEITAITLHEKLSALDKLAKHKGMYSDGNMTLDFGSIPEELALAIKNRLIEELSGFPAVPKALLTPGNDSDDFVDGEFESI